MRLVSLAFAALFASTPMASDALAAVPSNPAASLAAEIAASRQIEPVCRGCGCRGGAGYRLPSGKCAPRRR